MRGFKLNPTCCASAGRSSRGEHETHYRIWSVNDEHPAMIRVNDDSGASVALEVWAVPLAGIADLLRSEPPGLTIGKVELSDGARFSACWQRAHSSKVSARSPSTADGAPTSRPKEVSS